MPVTTSPQKESTSTHRERGASYKLGLIRDLVVRLDDAIEEIEAVHRYSDMTPYKRVLPDGLKGITASSLSTVKRAREKLSDALAEVEQSFAQ